MSAEAVVLIVYFVANALGNVRLIDRSVRVTRGTATAMFFVYGLLIWFVVRLAAS